VRLLCQRLSMVCAQYIVFCCRNPPRDLRGDAIPTPAQKCPTRCGARTGIRGHKNLLPRARWRRRRTGRVLSALVGAPLLAFKGSISHNESPPSGDVGPSANVWNKSRHLFAQSSLAGQMRACTLLALLLASLPRPSDGHAPAFVPSASRPWGRSPCIGQASRLLRGARFAAMTGHAAASVPLRRLADLSQAGPEAEGTVSEIVRAALAGVTIADFGAAAAGWPRCYRSTRVVVKVRAPLARDGAASRTVTATDTWALDVQEGVYCSVSVLLLPAGEKIPPYCRPGAEVCGFFVLKGSVGLRALACSERGEGATLAKGLPENGLHDPRSLAAQTNKNGCITPGAAQAALSSELPEMEPDCVCRGGMCPRRSGCKFWVELMRERNQRAKARLCLPCVNKNARESV
jgi:hypothetical protein